MPANGMFIEWTFGFIWYLDLYGYVHQGISKENVLVLIKKADEWLRWCLAYQG